MSCRGSRRSARRERSSPARRPPGPAGRAAPSWRATAGASCVRQNWRPSVYRGLKMPFLKSFQSSSIAPLPTRCWVEAIVNGAERQDVNHDRPDHEGAYRGSQKGEGFNDLLANVVNFASIRRVDGNASPARPFGGKLETASCFSDFFR
ncbi:protein of unknown function [Shinella sp. WSC3-e]|nr:protein of unknown function [Shinella sp. WSC3-e]